MPAKIQNFALAQGDSYTVKVDVDPDDGISIAIGCIIWWTAFEQQFGVPDRTKPVIRKVLDHGIEIDDIEMLLYHVTIDRSDTLALLGNYFHESNIQDPSGKVITVNYGMVAVTQTANRNLAAS